MSKKVFPDITDSDKQDYYIFTFERLGFRLKFQKQLDGMLALKLVVVTIILLIAWAIFVGCSSVFLGTGNVGWYWALLLGPAASLEFVYLASLIWRCDWSV